MKKFLTILLVLMMAFCMFGTADAQTNISTVNFNNRAPAFNIDAPIYDLTVGGTLLEGTGYWAQLWAAPVGSSDFKPAGIPVNFRTGVAAGYVNVGVDSSRTLPLTLNPLDSAWLSIYAWTDGSSKGLDSITSMSYKDSYNFALLNPDADLHFGRSHSITIQPSTYGEFELPYPPANMVGIMSFAILPLETIPEPNNLILIPIGLVAMFFFVRKEKNLTKN